MRKWHQTLPDMERSPWAVSNASWYLRASGAATTQLVRARWRLRDLLPHDITEMNQGAAASGRPAKALLARDEVLIDRVGWIVPRVAKRLPIRSDCLIQAMAGQKLLLAGEIASRIVLAAEKLPPPAFQPHAMLLVGETCVIGGDQEQFEVIFGED